MRYYRAAASLVVSVCVIFLGIFTYALFFKDNTKPAYFSTYEKYNDNEHIGIMCDGTYLYDYDYNTNTLTNKRLCIDESCSAVALLNVDGKDFKITSNSDYPATYTCTQADVSKYINALKSQSYDVVSMEADATHIDYTLKGKEYLVRVIWNINTTCYIFCQDSGKNYTEPPYINE